VPSSSTSPTPAGQRLAPDGRSALQIRGACADDPTVAERIPSPGQQAVVDAHRRYRELRKQHIRRTQRIGGRLYLGPVLNPLAGIWLLVGASAAVAGLAGWGPVDPPALAAAVFLLAGLVVLAVAGKLLKRFAARPSAPGRDAVAGFTLAAWSLMLVVSRDTAEFVGILLGAAGAVALVKAAIGLVLAGFRRLFRRRPRPEELESVERSRPAA